MSTPDPSKLKEADLRRLLACVRELSCLEGVEDFHGHAIRVLRGLVDDEWIASETFDGQTLAWQGGIVDPIIPGNLYEVFQQRAVENPLLQTLQEANQSPKPAVMTWASVLQDERAHETLPIWHDFYGKLDITHQAASFQVLPDGTLLTHGFSRDGLYTGGELALIEMAHAHLANAYLSHRALQRAKAEPDWLIDGLEHLGSGLIRIDRAGKVQRQTPHASNLLATYFKNSPRQLGRLPQRLASWLTNILPDDPDQFVAPTPVQVPDATGQSVLQVRLIRASRQDGYLLILDERWSVPSAERLQNWFGLPPKRAAVLHLLAQGLDNKAIAQKLGLTVGTIRKHLEYTFRTLNVTSRAQAIARVAEVRS